MGFDRLYTDIQYRTRGFAGVPFRNQLNNVLFPRGEYRARSLLSD